MSPSLNCNKIINAIFFYILFCSDICISAANLLWLLLFFVCYIRHSYSHWSCCADSGMTFKFISALMSHCRRPADSSGAVRLTQVHQCAWYIHDLSKVNEFWRVMLSSTCVPSLLPLGWGTLWAPGSQSASTSSAVSSPPPSAHLRQLSPFQTQLIWTPANVYRLAKSTLQNVHSFQTRVRRFSGYIYIHLTQTAAIKLEIPWRTESTVNVERAHRNRKSRRRENSRLNPK